VKEIAPGEDVDGAGFARPPFLPSSTARANRRRLLVFLGVFVVSAAAALSYTFLRPAEYRATARIEIKPGSEPERVEPAPGTSGDRPKPFLTEVEVLASRPVLDQVVARLRGAGEDLTAFGPEPIEGIRSALELMPVAGTNVVEIAARGGRPSLLAATVNNVIEVYRAHLANAFRGASDESMAQALEETRKLEASVLAKRRDVEAFRARHNIVSLEREENDVLARVRGLGTSLAAANDRVAIAEGKVRSLTESATAGKGVVRSRDNPTLANLEQRASQIREELRELERSFTPDYLAMDPKMRAERTRLAELEEQIKAQRETSQSAAVRDAEEELAAAREAARRLQQQIATDRQEVNQFTMRFNEYKSLQAELTQLETAYRDAVQRRAKLEATERARTPTVRTLEAATVPREAWRPLYMRDAALSVTGALVLALFAVWLVELFNRPDPQPPVVIAQPVMSGMLVLGTPQIVTLAGQGRVALEPTDQALLPQPQTLPRETLPRELRGDELDAMIRAGDDGARIAMLLLLYGVAPEELTDLRWSDVDLERRVIRVRGESSREISIRGSLESQLVARTASPKMPLVPVRGRPATPSDLGEAILYAAHDAGIERPSEVTAASLRHTYIAFLVRQGIRFADLARVVGRLPPEELAAYRVLVPPGPRASLDAIDRVFPPLRSPDPNGEAPA
jgi:succinoglycan biosynthesis transport protein ExoP